MTGLKYTYFKFFKLGLNLHIDMKYVSEKLSITKMYKEEKLITFKPYIKDCDSVNYKILV